MVLVPIVEKDSMNCFSIPLTSVTIVMTAETPIIMPSIVKNDRPLLLRMDLMAIEKAWLKFMPSPPQMNTDSLQDGRG